MRRAVVMAAIIALLVTATEAGAHHKPKHQHMPPGQMKKHLSEVYQPLRVAPLGYESVCVIETADPEDPLTGVVFSEWLPRDEAELAIEKFGGFIIIHPDLSTREECENFAVFEE